MLQWRGLSLCPLACAQRLLTVCVPLAFAHRASALGRTLWGFMGPWNGCYHFEVQCYIGHWYTCEDLSVSAWLQHGLGEWQKHGQIWLLLKAIVLQTQAINVFTCSRLVALVAHGHIFCGWYCSMPCQPQAFRGKLRLLVPNLYLASKSVCWWAYRAQHHKCYALLAAMPAEFFSPALCGRTQGHTCIGASCHLCSEDSSCYNHQRSYHQHSAVAYTPASMGAQTFTLLMHTANAQYTYAAPTQNICLFDTPLQRAAKALGLAKQPPVVLLPQDDAALLQHARRLCLAILQRAGCHLSTQQTPASATLGAQSTCNSTCKLPALSRLWPHGTCAAPTVKDALGGS